MQRLNQAGFNLIEVMIALVIISIGLLGLAGLQVTSLQQNQSALYRTQATIFAYDIGDRIRANQAAIDTYFNATGTLNNSCVNFSGSVDGCTPVELAAHDIAEWQASIAAELPSGGGRVCRSDLSGDDISMPACELPTSNNPIVVYVWWNDDKSASGASAQFTVSLEI